MAQNSGGKHSNAFSVFVMLALLVGCIIFFFDKKISQIQYNELKLSDIYIAPVTTDGYMNIALFGVDARNVDEKNVRSDTIIIASINEDTYEVKLTSVFRDTYVYVENYGKNNSITTDDYTKITHAYAFGGPALAVSTLNENFDLNITEYATVNFYVLADIVNQLGGLDINIETTAMVDSINRYGKEVADGENKVFTNVTSTGPQLLDGYQVLGYARTRKIDSDFKRAERQREVLSKILAELKSSNLTTLNNIYNDVADNLETSMGSNEILALLPNISKYEIGTSNGFPYNNYTAKRSGSSSMEVYSENMIDDICTLHSTLYPDIEYEPSDRVRNICATLNELELNREE